jgi:hypothetical protein
MRVVQQLAIAASEVHHNSKISLVARQAVPERDGQRGRLATFAFVKKTQSRRVSGPLFNKQSSAPI